MFPIPSWATVAIIIVLMIGAFGSGWKWRADIAERDRVTVENEALKAKEELQKKADTQAAELQKKLSALSVKAQQIEGELFDELQKSVYRDCLVPADGVRIINSAIADR